MQKRMNEERNKGESASMMGGGGGEIGTLREVYSNGPGTDIERIKPTKGLPATMADMLLCF